MKGLAGVVDQFNAPTNVASRCLDQLGDLPRRVRRSTCKVAHLGGDHRKAATSLARSSGLDARVQSQKVGLECDLVNHLEDLADRFRGRPDLVHGSHGTCHHL